MDRRRFLAGSGALGAAPLLSRLGAAATPGAFSLRAAATEVPLLGPAARKTPVWAYNGKVPGPEIRMCQGGQARIEFKNDLDVPTTVHWHGLRVPNAMDGVPYLTQPPVAPGAGFNYEFSLPDAGTYWYHAHLQTSEQIERGLQGAFIIEERNPPNVDRDIVWVIDDWRIDREGRLVEPFDQLGVLSHAGRIGNVASLNGIDSGTFQVRAGERLRLRLINTANARNFALTFEGHKPVVIAREGQPTRPHTPKDGRIVLAPAQRADIIVDLGGKPGSRYAVTDSYYRRQNYKYLDLVYAPDPPLRDSPLDAPLALEANPLAEPDLAGAARHDVLLTGGAMGGMVSATFKGQEMDIRTLAQHKKVWAINGIAAHGMAMTPMLRLSRGRSYILKFRNETAWPHPMHLHGHPMKLLRRDGRPVDPPVWSDTVLVDPRETAEVALVADNPGKWLFHCHVLEHAAAGMSGVVAVS